MRQGNGGRAEGRPCPCACGGTDRPRAVATAVLCCAVRARPYHVRYQRGAGGARRVAVAELVPAPSSGLLSSARLNHRAASNAIADRAQCNATTIRGGAATPTTVTRPPARRPSRVSRCSRPNIALYLQIRGMDRRPGRQLY